ncbi:DUF262 domain-containing protein [Brachyspira intermedia]|uniref:DUF262 domain-containing protein n=1 Tax=Brachyspira intermedia TaxID=84377 RepID=UPI0030059638
MFSEELNILKLYEIFSNNDFYRIPIYQRNFAWRAKEILELLLDIYNQYINDTNSNYYIGSLVVSKKIDKKNIYDVIDGQQRLTVISLIYIYLREKSLLTKNELINKDITISFEIRDEINEYLKKKLGKEEINEAYVTEENGLQSFEYAFNVINNFFDEYFKENEDIKKEYTDFLFDKVQIIRIILPKDTDLIEYFEIMNTRGEQLELHDILKARLLNLIKEGEKRKQYSYIWEIVSDFSIYPSCKLDIENIESVINNENIFEKMNDELSDISGKSKLSDIFNEIDTVPTDTEPDEKTEPDERFKSIIDFPNFLLIALKLYLLDDEKKSKISLNSQSLLIHFNDYLMDKNFTISFIGKLFEYRLIFDSYVIKQDNKKENNEKYRIQKYKKNKDNEKYYINTITNELEEDKAKDNNKKLLELLEYFIIHLQTILENLNPTKQNKTWLYEALNSLINNCEEDRLISFTNSLWKSLIENISNLNFNELHYSDISHKLFYYIDFLILLEFKLNQNDFKNNYFENNESKFNNFKKIADDFEFASVSSVEHIYSQEKAKHDGLNDEVLHCIGNLCLISKSQNTSLRDDSFESKKTYYFTKERTFNRKYSLKQALVFCKYDEWKEDNINIHKGEIINLLEKYKKDKDNLYSIITENK